MTRIQAALTDLMRLRGESAALDNDLARWPGELEAALDRAWATSAPVLGTRTDLDQQMASQLRAGAGLVDGTTAAVTRLARAGSDSPALRVVPAGSPRSPSGRLLRTLALDRTSRLAGLFWGRIENLFSGDGRSRRAHVVQTSTESYGGTVLWARGSTTLIREVMSDGTVRITAMQQGSLELDIGWGAEIARKVAGVEFSSGQGSLNVRGEVMGAMAQSWTFPGEAAAEAFLDQHRWQLLGQALLPGGSLGAAVLERARDALLGEGGLPPFKEAYVEVSLEVALNAGLSASGGLGQLLAMLVPVGAQARATASLAVSDRVRIHDNGSVTLIRSGAALAEAGFDAVAWSAGTSGQAAAGANLAIEVTASRSGQLEQVVMRRESLADPGQQISLAEALSSTYASSSFGNTLHQYESTLTLDLTDPEVRAAVEAALGLDLDSAADQVQAALAVLLLQPAVLRTAHVSVLERGAVQDNVTKLGVNVEAGPVDFEAGGEGGTTTQATTTAWEKRSGSLDLLPVA